MNRVSLTGAILGVVCYLQPLSAVGGDLKQLATIAENFKCEEVDFKKLKDLIPDQVEANPNAAKITDKTEAVYEAALKLNEKIEKKCPRTALLTCSPNLVAEVKTPEGFVSRREIKGPIQALGFEATLDQAPLAKEVVHETKVDRLSAKKGIECFQNNLR